MEGEAGLSWNIYLGNVNHPIMAWEAYKMNNSGKCNPNFLWILSPSSNSLFGYSGQSRGASHGARMFFFMWHTSTGSCRDSICSWCHSTCYTWLQALHLFFLRSIDLTCSSVSLQTARWCSSSCSLHCAGFHVRRLPTSPPSRGSSDLTSTKIKSDLTKQHQTSLFP